LCLEILIHPYFPNGHDSFVSVTLDGHVNLFGRLLSDCEGVCQLDMMMMMMCERWPVVSADWQRLSATFAMAIFGDLVGLRPSLSLACFYWRRLGR
jgi:hypothetical protein